MPRKRPPSTIEVGAPGLRHYGGRIDEEYHPKLRGGKATAIYEEMRDNDATVGAVFYTIESFLRAVDWKAEGPDEAEEEFLESCMHDMETSWEDMIGDALSFLIYGHALHEVVYKIRLGTESENPRYRSDHDDARIGWRNIALRSQRTIDRWDIDDQGNILGCWQTIPSQAGGNEVYLPMNRCVLFRTTTRKNNPEGRALDPATPIPTPDGWRTMDEIRPGDKIFDEQGRIRYVTARKDWENRPRYRVTFSTGHSIIADENHQWVAQNYSQRMYKKPGSLVTTKDFYNKPRAPGGHSNFSIDWAGALDYPEQHLPIDPYILGYWLGDGTSLSGTITTHVDDVPDLVREAEAAGYTTAVKHNGEAGGLGRRVHIYGHARWGRDGLASQLRILGLIGNKHVPPAYLRGSKAQRLSLLAGLMDSDGHCVGTGGCEFSNTNPKLAKAVAELVRSLGCAAYETTKQNSAGNTAYAVRFSPTFAPFRLPRKVARIKQVRAREKHYVKTVERLENGRTVCIEVDSPSHLFLAGEGMVPTHNSILRNAYRSWYFKKRLEEIEAIGISRDLGGLPVVHVPASIMSATATAAQRATRASMETLVSQLHRDEREGVVFPSEEDGTGQKTGYKLSLLASSGQKQIPADPVIRRYDARIAMSMASEFLLLGTEKQGSYALGAEKSANFLRSLSWYIDQICTQLNKGPVKRLYDVNNVPVEKRAKIVAGEIDMPGLQELGVFIQQIAGSGLLHPTPEVENKLRAAAKLPVMPDEELQALFEEEKAAKEKEAELNAQVMQAKAQPPGAASKPKPGAPDAE